jgi:hypothetical protein
VLVVVWVAETLSRDVTDAIRLLKKPSNSGSVHDEWLDGPKPWRR